MFRQGKRNIFMHVCTEKRPKFQPLVGKASYGRWSICNAAR